MHKYYIEKIIESNNNEKMEKLREILVDTISYLKDIDYEKYRSIECKLYEIVEGKKLTEKKAKEWVEEMRPTYKWTMEETNQVKMQNNVDIPEIDFYVLMNMLYTDYSRTLGEDVQTYINLAHDWYYDSDTSKEGPEKLYCYWKNIVK